MSKMLTEIKRIVEEDISSRVTQYDVIFEALTNSIHANATNIICELKSYDNPQKEGEVELAPRKVDTIIVSDNGDGFNDDNYGSFCKYRSGYKKELGGKGVGRFSFLKVYERAKYISKLKKEQEIRSFTFDLNFDTDDLKKESADIEHNLTEVKLSTLTKQYKYQDRLIDRRIELNLGEIREKVLLNLIPTLFFYKKRMKEVEITFLDTDSGKKESINKNDIPNFSEKKFKVKDKDGQEKEFILHHKIKKGEGALNAFHCANNRTVCDFASKEFKMTLPYGYSGFILLESDYFDTHANNERNDFDIFPVKTDMFSTISWEMINDNLKPQITELVKEGIPETTNVNKKKLKEIQDERPYLVNYISEDDIEMAGFLDKKQVIEKAKKRFDAAKEKILANSGKDKFSDTDLEEAIQLTQNEFVSYIFDRVQVIERLKSLIDNKEKVEEIIHNLFMQKHTDDDYFCINRNNLWLLDDRYTSYSYAASDKRIKDVLVKLDSLDGDEENPDDKPDISLFFSHDPEYKRGLKSVLIELKSFDYDYKADKKKFQGIQQLLDYAEAFKDKEKIEEVWAFLITDVDDKLAARLERDSYARLFSTDAPIFHRPYENGVSIYVVGAKTLISDAEARNKIFLDIIKKQNRLRNILMEKEAEKIT